MKKFLLAIALIFSMTLEGHSQIDYPCYQKDSLGQSVVLLTIEQAQALDNSTDLLVLFEKLNTQLTSYDSVCIKVVADKDRVIAEQTFQIKALKDLVGVKDHGGIATFGRTLVHSQPKLFFFRGAILQIAP